MNGIHDMGGMQDMGPIQYDKNEPVFHASWEARAFALGRAMVPWKKWNLDSFRYWREMLPPVDYMGMSYHESRFVVLIGQLLRSGLVTSSEIASGIPDEGSPKAVPPLTPDKIMLANRGAKAKRDLTTPPRYQVGQSVRARNIHPVGHTRLPRYARGKHGTIAREYGGYIFPDTNAHFLGENPQHLYSVRFTARELWGEGNAANDTVYIDLWDDYLEPA